MWNPMVSYTFNKIINNIDVSIAIKAPIYFKNDNSLFF
jgi:hypothetical protein